MKPVEPPAVTLEHWYSPIWGNQFALVHEGKTILIRPTELEARRAAREHGWVVAERVELELLP